MSATKPGVTTPYDDILDSLELQGYAFSRTLMHDCLQALIHRLMGIEVSQILDASRYERSHTRRAYRNGYRTTVWRSPVGQMEIQIPKLRRGTYYPDRLLNDRQVAETLTRIVKICILKGVDEEEISTKLTKLGLFTLSTYEIHQVCDAIRSQLEGLYHQDTYENAVKFIGGEHISERYHKQIVLMQKRNADGVWVIVDAEETVQTDRKFWKNFSRRMALAESGEESYQSVLSGINPYATLTSEQTSSVVHLNPAKHIHSLYEDEYQLIA